MDYHEYYGQMIFQTICKTNYCFPRPFQDPTPTPPTQAQ